MSRYSFAVVEFVALISCWSAVSIAEEAPGAAERLRGYWKYVEGRWRDEPFDLLKWNLNIDAGTIEIEDEAKVWSGKLTLHAGGDPELLDIQVDKITVAARYRLRGDKLTLALHNGIYDGRPKGLEPSADDESKFVLTLERSKPPPAIVAGDDETARNERTRRSRLRAGGKLHRLNMAMWFYVQKHNQWPAPATTGKDGAALLSWRVALLPHLGEQELYDQFHHDEPWDSEHNRKLLPLMPAVYASEGNAPQSRHGTFFQVFVGEGCSFEPGKSLGWEDFPDGTTNAIGIVIASKDVPWSKPQDIAYDKSKPLPSFIGGMFDDGLFSFSNLVGDVHVITNLFSEKKETLLRNCLTRNDAQPGDVLELSKEN